MSILKIEPAVSNSSANFSFGNVFASNFYYANGTLFSGGSGAVKYISSSTPPSSNNSPGDQWFNSATQTLYEYINDGVNSYWVETLTPSFPSTPINGQTTTVKGIVYSYDTTTSSWTRISQTSPTMSVIVDTFIGDGVTTVFSLSTTPAAKEFITVNIDGVLQQTTAYTLTTNSLTLTGTPISGAVIEVKTTSANQSTIITGLNYDTFTGDGSKVAFTLTTIPTTKYFTLVTIGGVVQNKTNYNVSGNVLTFSTAPLNTSPIEVVTFGPAVNSTSVVAAGSNTQIQINTGNLLDSSANLTFDKTTNTLTTTNLVASFANVGTITSTGNIVGLTDLYVGNGAAATAFNNPIAIFKDTGLTYVQAAIVNSSGNGSADITTYGNNGDDTQSWTDMGFTGNTFNDANYTVTGPGDGYLFVQGNTSFGGNLVIATGNTGTTKDIVFATGGFQTGNIKARLYNSNGTLSVSNTVAAGNLYTSGTLTVTGMATFQQTSDAVVSLTGATGTVVHDMSLGAVFSHTSVAANFTANFTNVPTTDGKASMATLMITQGSSAYYPNAVQINGVAQTLKWAGGVTPTPNASKVDIVAISLIRVSGSWSVLGQLATYG